MTPFSREAESLVQVVRIDHHSRKTQQRERDGVIRKRDQELVELLSQNDLLLLGPGCVPQSTGTLFRGTLEAASSLTRRRLSAAANKSRIGTMAWSTILAAVLIRFRMIQSQGLLRRYTVRPPDEDRFPFRALQLGKMSDAASTKPVSDLEP